VIEERETVRWGTLACLVRHTAHSAPQVRMAPVTSLRELSRLPQYIFSYRRSAGTVLLLYTLFRFPFSFFLFFFHLFLFQTMEDISKKAIR